MSTLAFKQVQVETFPDGAPIRKRWLRVSQALEYGPWGRAKLYGLMNSGSIKSFSLKEPGNTRGIRLIDKDSIDQYLERAAAAAELAQLSQEEAAA